jgi:hypothetical protein
MTSTIFQTLTAPDLTVFTSESEGFEDAVASKAFIGNLDRNLFPDAVLVACSVAAVQVAVRFCAQHKLRICPRSGGHNWHAIWLQGKGSIVLDLGKLNEVSFNAENKSISAGPGASNINQKIPEEWFWPGGHCPGVPLAGFILGGGFGVGFPKYGMSSTLVTQVEVVLACGDVKMCKVGHDESDPISAAVMQLVCGSYHQFPAIITKFVFQAVPTPACVLAPMFMFKLSEWKRAVQIIRDMQHRGDEDVTNIEANLIMGYSPPPVAEATGETKMAALGLFVFGDTQDEARALVDKYTKTITGTLVPPGPYDPIPAKAIPDMFAAFYPEKARYLSEGFVGDERIHDMDDDAVCAMVQPLANMWLSDSAPPPTSHSIMPMLHKSFHKVNQRGLATGFTPSLAVLAYAIYQDNAMDDTYAKMLQDGMKGFHEAAGMWTELAEGNIRADRKQGFNEKATAELEKNVALLDPNGLFSNK